jgi:hypothetical protein
MSGGPSTPIEQVTELGEQIIQKLVAAGITTVEALADMTPEQLEEIPGIGERTLEKIGTAVRHYFGQYEPGEEHAGAAADASQSDEEGDTSMVAKTEETFTEDLGAEGTSLEQQTGDVQIAFGDDPGHAVAQVLRPKTVVGLDEGSDAGALTEEEQDRLDADPELSLAADIERASSEEEEAALRLDNDEETEVIPDNRDGSGRIVDDIAAQRMEKLTESGEDVGEFGVENLAPGRDDTSETLEAHRPRMADGELSDKVNPDESESKQEDEDGI